MTSYNLATLKTIVGLAPIVASRVALRRQGRELVGSCPFHNEKTPSFKIYDDDHFHCYGCGAHGDVIDFVQRADGLAVPEAIERLRHLAGESQPRRSIRASGDEEKDKKVVRAREIWRAAMSMDHPDAELGRRYLRRRGIAIPAPDTIRFAPALWHDLERRTFPALVCAVAIWPEGRVSGIWRIYLDSHGGKAPVEKPKMGLGRAAGGAVRLEPAAARLGLAEGVETAMSIQQAADLPVWACLSAGGLRTVILPPTVRDILIAADGDPVGERAAQAAAERFLVEGRQARIARPPTNMDFNDVLRQGISE